MSTHLTEEEISQRIAGYTSEELDRHVRECGECAGKVTSFDTIVSAFRVTADDWANRAGGLRVPGTSELVRTSRQVRMRSLRWVAAAALVTVVAVVPAYKKSLEPAGDFTEVRESQSDKQLLERVNAHLSHTAPVSFQPLMQMPEMPEMVPARSDAKSALKSEGEHR